MKRAIVISIILLLWGGAAWGKDIFISNRTDLTITQAWQEMSWMSPLRKSELLVGAKNIECIGNIYIVHYKDGVTALSGPRQSDVNSTQENRDSIEFVTNNTFDNSYDLLRAQKEESTGNWGNASWSYENAGDIPGMIHCSLLYADDLMKAHKYYEAYAEYKRAGDLEKAKGAALKAAEQSEILHNYKDAAYAYRDAEDTEKYLELLAKANAQ